MRIRSIGLLAAAIFSCTGIAASNAASDEHQLALAALADVRATVAEITAIENGNAVGHPSYLRAAHRALNAIVGRGDGDYDAKAGDPGDGIGAIGNVDRLLDRRGTTRWTMTIQGAKANLLAAAQNVHDALREKEMESYQADLTQALANLSLAVGRPDREGVLGGIAGAMGTTALGVPAGVSQVSGCATARNAPAYGVADGRLLYVALPQQTAAKKIPENVSVSRVVVERGMVILYTPAGLSSPACSAVASTRVRTRDVVRARVVVAAAGGPTAPFTLAQARAGKKVYAAACVQCHGANLQGSAGPAFAGTEFLRTAKTNKWSLEDLRTLVFDNMPLNNPGSLKPTEYANVMAFLLAANCYPPGKKPFPTNDDPSFAKIKLQPPSGVHPTGPNGTCPVK